jgi:transposase-like protein
VCPCCGATKAWETGRHLLRCVACQRQTSLTAGTIFDGTRKPLRTWFQAMWYVTNQKLGVSALGLQRVLGLASYQTAWAWLHKLRRAMVRPGRDRLQGVVEVDESYVGGEEEGTRGRETYTKGMVVIAVEIHEPKGFGRVRLRQINDVSSASLTPFVYDVVEPGATVHTDGWGGYNDIGKFGYNRKVTVLSASDDPAHVLMPGVHRVAALLKRWLLGTHQGAVSNRHLDYYLDEYTFRFNRRASRARGLLFHRLMEQALQTAPVAYARIVGGRAAGASDG